MSRYSKGVEGVDHFHQPDDLFEYAGESFDVRITVLDEPPEQGLWASVTGDQIGRTIGDILDDWVIGREPRVTELIREEILELDEFPHLSDALDRVADIWHRFRSDDDVGLAICVNNGPDDIAIEDTAREHMGTCVWRNGQYDYMLLDLVFEPSELTLAGMLGDRKREFLLWLQGLVALYKLDLDPSVERALRKRPELEPVREQLHYHNLVAPAAKGKLEITQQGRRAIGRILLEQEDLISRYDLYRDVVIRKGEGGEPRFEFATLAGVDYRVAVYRHVGLDPFRAVFLLTLLAGELDAELEGKGWLEAIVDEHFYEKVLKVAVDHMPLGEDRLAALVAQGEQYLAKAAAMRERARYSEEVLARTGTIEAFPRKGGTVGLPLHRPSPATPASPPAEEPPPLAAPPVPAAPEPGEPAVRSVTRRRRTFGALGRRPGPGRAPTGPPPVFDLPPPPPQGEERPSGRASTVDLTEQANREVEEALADDGRDADVAEAEREIEEELSRPARRRARRSGPDPEDDGWL